jgi:hypothetical protein
MSNTGYHVNGKPCWWARVGSGDGARFLTIPRVRGDQMLSCVVDVEPGTVVSIGAGKGSHKTIRETVITTEIETNEGVEAAS